MQQNISQELETEINMIMDLQKKLLFLSEDTIESVCDFILESIFIHSSERPHQLTSSLFVAIEYRPWSIPYIAQLCYLLLKSASSTNSLSKLKFDILFTIFNKECIKQENLHFLAHCLEVEFLYSEELVDFIHQFMIEKSNFVKEILEYFAWFAPEIEMTNSVLFDQLYSLYSKQCSINRHDSMSSEEENENEYDDNDDDDDENDNNKNGELGNDDFEPELDIFFRNFEDLRKDNWQLLKQYRLNGCNHNKINTVIKNDDADELQRIISEDDLDINTTSQPSIFELSLFCQFEPTLIQIAAFYRSVKCFKYLFSNGADILKCDEDLKPTIHFAVAGGNNEIIRILQRANIDFSGAANVAASYHRNDIFHWIYDTIECNLKFVDNPFRTILHSSCGSNNLEIFSFCMKNGANVNQKDETGWTPLCSAIWNNRVEMVKILLSNIDLDINAKTEESWTALYTAAFSGRPEFINLLKNVKGIDANIKSKRGWSPLFAATATSQIECVHALLGFDDIDVNLTTNEGWTPLYIACDKGQYDIVCLLLKKDGIKVNIQTKEGKTPLYVASQRGHVNIVVMLLNFPGIDVNARDEDGIFFLFYFSYKTALHAAAENNQLQVVLTLLYNEVTEVNAKTKDNKTAFELAFDKNFDEVAKILITRRILM